ncbi:MAG TPA: hypothetical protein VFI73_13060 [Candidatus Nitrosopolaris sp.]|nr:hypothetical protein [Candidatus Nitrosopolaris sp.]
MFRPKDFPNVGRKIVEESIKDLSPDIKDNVLKILDSWEGVGSQERLKVILGQDKADSIFKKIKASKDEVTDDEQEKLQDMFKESLTFD